MNLILLFPDDFIGNHRVQLSGRRAEHILKVQRAKTGDELTVGLAGGMTGRGTLLAVEREGLVLEVSVTQPPPPPLPLTLLLALPRPKVLRRVLQTAATMGVKKLCLINAFRVEKSYWSSPFLGMDDIRRQLVLGLEQARDTVMPEVLLRPLFKPFVEDELPAIMGDSLPLTADPGATEACPRHVQRSVTLAIGPEGGFIQYELDKLAETGFKTVSMGDRILRVETAVPALLSRLY